MQDKFFVLMTYALMGMAIALWPLCVTEKRATIAGDLISGSKPPTATITWLTAIVFLIGAIGVTWIIGESVASPLILTIILVALATSISGGRFDVVSMLVGFFSLCVSVTLLWWRHWNGSVDISWYKLSAFFLITLVCTRLFSARVTMEEDRFPTKALIVYTLVAALLTFSTGIFDDRYAFQRLWNHWGAYVGPSELLLSGAAIFHDFPAQYGLGPTALIAGFCGQDCWHAMYFIAGFVTLAYSVLLAVLALSLSRNRWPERLSVLALCLATSYFWTAYPLHVNSPMTTPSVSGMRFLPAMLLLTYLLLSKDIEHSKPKMLVAHVLWALGVLWSIESAFYVTFLWWPYYLFIRRTQGDLFSRVKGFARAGISLFAAGVVLVIVFDGIFWLIYKEGPTLHGILAYAINPPGPLPINWHGAVWYFLLVTVVGLCASLRTWRMTGDTPVFRRGFLLQLLSYGAVSYFLGRSHDNNLLNIMPLLLLVLLQAISTAKSKILSKMSVVLAATLVGWLPTFGWQAWDEDVMQGRVLTFDPKITDEFSPGQPRSALRADALYGIKYIRQHYGEPVTVLDGSFDLMHSSPPAPWSAIHGPENFAFMPSDERREFLYNTAASLKRTGWVIVNRRFPADDWLADFDFAYQRTARLEFGRYYAIRYSPKIH